MDYKIITFRGGLNKGLAGPFCTLCIKHKVRCKDCKENYKQLLRSIYQTWKLLSKYE